MADEDTDTGTDVGEGDPAPTPEPDPVEDFAEKNPDWRESITDDKLRSSVEKYGSIDDLVRSHNALGGELRNRIKVPGDDASQEDLDKYHQALGVPQEVTGYTMPEIENYEPDEMDSAMFEEMAEIAWAHNIPAQAFQDFMGSILQKGIETGHERAAEIDEYSLEAETELRTKWGADFEKHINLAARAAKLFGGDPFVEALENLKVEGKGTLGDVPEVVELLANLGRRLDESDLHVLSEPEVRSSAQERLNQILADNPPGTPEYSSPAVQQEIAQLYEQIHGKASI